MINTGKENTVLVNLLFTVIMLMSLNFFLTQNPFSALHSGEVGFVQGASTSFFLAPAYIILFSILIMVFKYRNIMIDYKVVIILCVFILSGIITNSIFQQPQTYLYNITSFSLLLSLAISSYKVDNRSEIKSLGKIIKVMSFLLIVGIVLAILFPYKYGILPFEFSRVTRGEVTYWNVTGLIVLYPILSIISYRKLNLKYPIFLSLIMILIIISTASRGQIVLSTLPFIIYFIFVSKPIVKIFSSILISALLIFFSKKIFNYFTDVSTNSSQQIDFTNGRLVLWEYHWQYFINNFLIGAGPAFINKMNDYFGRADSEIGILMWFSEYGIVYGITMCIFVIKALITSISLIMKGKDIKDVELLVSLIFLSMLPNLVQSYARILTIDDMIFWFSIFYLNAYRGSLFPYLLIKRSKNKYVLENV